MRKIIKFTNEKLEHYKHLISIHKKYGNEGRIIESAIKQNPFNNDIAIVSMKICLIDLTNGTNLIKQLGTDGGLYLLAEKISNSKTQFDEKIKIGNIDLVNELARWTKENFGKNLTSFISKYCLYHNYYYYKKDDYVIYDGILAENLCKYISNEDYKNLTGNKLYKNSVKKLIEKFDYGTYRDIIDTIIKNNNISLDKPRRMTDWFIWYTNHPKLKKQK